MERMTSVEIQSVQACACPGHARVVLRDPAARRSFRVRVHADAGQALLAEMNGISGDRAALITMMSDAMTAAGGRLDGLVIQPVDDDIHAWLHVVDAHGRERCIDAEPCEALILAYRLRLPVWVNISGRHDAVPEVYREVVETLDLEGL
jgi:bifunctional DNase/RNase